VGGEAWIAVIDLAGAVGLRFKDLMVCDILCLLVDEGLNVGLGDFSVTDRRCHGLSVTLAMRSIFRVEQWRLSAIIAMVSP
jgi:hypothetical protein